jgi:hypothetical protein
MNVTTYEACYWNAQQFHDFIPYLYNALTASNVAATKIILPESQNWTDPSNLVTVAMSDSTSNYVSVVANHNYVANNAVGDQSVPSAITSYGKARWETEVALLSGSDSSITNAVYWAGRIHSFLTAAQVNAWHYWWLMPGSTAGNEALTDTNGVPAKRMYALGQFSRFVRPNYYRLNVTNNTGSALVSAYQDSVSSNFAIVAINSSSVVVTQTFSLANFATVSNVTPWITSATMSLSNQPPVTVGGAAFNYGLPAMSIVTFVGQPVVVPSNAPPVFTPVAPLTANPGASVRVTNFVTDPDLPGQTLTFTLLAAPTNATLTALNASNVLLTWRPLISQAASTNLIQLKVADNATPALSATNNFTITVNAASPPALNSIALGSQVSLSATGMTGPDYTLLVSSNLVNWQSLSTTNPAALPVTFTDTNANSPARFYRLQLGP